MTQPAGRAARPPRAVTVIRPGALGDVLAVRRLIRQIALSFPTARRQLVAPGERGKFLCRHGWADRWFDADRSLFSWIHGESPDPPPPALAAVFSDSDVVIAFADFPGPAERHRFTARLRALAPATATVLLPPSQSPPGSSIPIAQWLLAPLRAVCPPPAAGTAAAGNSTTGDTAAGDETAREATAGDATAGNARAGEATGAEVTGG
ncbi:MAG: hypothetical protein LIP77_04420, partial [Planctomycetes bacterium]|nr:hypothetical protein [Planctomycetota bacterium]